MLIGAARLFDLQGSMTDSAYYRLFRPERVRPTVQDALGDDMQKLAGDFQIVIEREEGR